MRTLFNRRTIKVFVRHSATCKDKKKGADWRQCHCPKSLLVYDSSVSTSTNRRISAKTRSWEQAEKVAQNYRDSFDPEKQELKQLRAAKQAEQKRIEEAIAVYYSDMIARLGDNGTVRMARSLFGHINPVTMTVTINGHLFKWLNTLSAADRPIHIADITASHLTAWRASWKFGDYTGAQRWGMVCSFFNFCISQGWIDRSPSARLKPLLAGKGNRTAIFSDDQYAAILEAVAQYDPENVPALTRRVWQQRLTTFVELLRWSGMAMIDAVQYRPELIDSEGVLRYRRQKTGGLATVVLPAHVIALLRSVPIEHDSVGTLMPFRMKHFTAHSDTVTWRKRLFVLFELAGIRDCRTERGNIRIPHPHMLRDTFAVWNLRHGASLHAVAKMLGHLSVKTTEKSYLPWILELEQAHIAEGRKVLEAGMPKTGKGGKVVKMGVIQ
jgi:integrase